MGRVYLATDTRLGRAVALKALAPHLTGDASHRERLRREARAAAALTHSGICTVYALEEIDGQLFIVSELVDGHTLRDEIRAAIGPPPTAIAATARELADALASAHAKGITHRDFKPENVMRDSDGRLKMLDFGLARIERVRRRPARARDDGRRARRHAGLHVAGAAERSAGRRALRRVRYGVVLYEYACGAHPFHASTPLGLVARVLESDAGADRGTFAAMSRRRWRPSSIAACGSRRPTASPPPATSSSALRASPSRGLRPSRSSRCGASISCDDGAVRRGVTSRRLVDQGAASSRTRCCSASSSRSGSVPRRCGVMRGHLLFTSAFNREHLTSERLRLRVTAAGRHRPADGRWRRARGLSSSPRVPLAGAS